jgi:hypothetical protein
MKNMIQKLINFFKGNKEKILIDYLTTTNQNYIAANENLKNRLLKIEVVIAEMQQNFNELEVMVCKELVKVGTEQKKEPATRTHSNTNKIKEIIRRCMKQGMNRFEIANVLNNSGVKKNNGNEYNYYDVGYYANYYRIGKRAKRNRTKQTSLDGVM